jgi:flagellar hook assembly protein FlgD
MARENGVMKDKLLFFHADGPAASVKIKLLDSAGKVVRTLAASASDQYRFEEYGAYAVLLKAENEEGETLAPGLYKLEIEAANQGRPVNAYLFEQGEVAGVSFEEQGVMLQVRSKDWENDGEEYSTRVPIGAIFAVLEGNAEG